MIEVITALLAAGTGGGGGAGIEPYDIVLSANTQKSIDGTMHQLIPLDGVTTLPSADYPILLDKLTPFVGKPVRKPAEFEGNTYGAALAILGDDGIGIVADVTTKKVYETDATLTRWKQVGDSFPGGQYPDQNYGGYFLITGNDRSSLFTFTIGYDGDDPKIFRSDDGGKTWKGLMGNPPGAEVGMGFGYNPSLATNQEGLVVAAMRDSINRNMLVWSTDNGDTWQWMNLETLIPNNQYAIPHVMANGTVVLIGGWNIVVFEPGKITLADARVQKWPKLPVGDSITVYGMVSSFDGSQGFILGDRYVYGWNNSTLGIADLRDLLPAGEYVTIADADGGAIFGGNSTNIMSMYWGERDNYGTLYTEIVRGTRDYQFVSTMTWIVGVGQNAQDTIYMSGQDQNVTGNNFMMLKTQGFYNGNMVMPDAGLGPFAKIVVPYDRQPN